MRAAKVLRQRFMAPSAWRWLGSTAGAILVKEVGLRALDDGCQRDHLTHAQCSVKLFIKVLMRTLACSLVWLVRWV